MFKKFFHVFFLMIINCGLFAGDLEQVNRYEMSSFESFAINYHEPFGQHVLSRVFYHDVINLLALNKAIKSSLIENNTNTLYTILYNGFRFDKPDSENNNVCKFENHATPFFTYFRDIVRYKQVLNDVRSNLTNSEYLSAGMAIPYELYYISPDNKVFGGENYDMSFLNKLHTSVQEARLLVLKPDEGDDQTSLELFKDYLQNDNPLHKDLMLQCKDIELNEEFIQELLVLQHNGKDIFDVSDDSMNILNVFDKDGRNIISRFFYKYARKKSVTDSYRLLFMQIIEKFGLGLFAHGQMGVIFNRAVHSGDLELVRCLLNKGFNCRLRSYCFLGSAINKQLFDTARLLLEHGSNINAKKNVKKEVSSCFTDCLRNKNIKGIQFLLNNGFDIHIHDEDVYNEYFQCVISECFRYFFYNDVELIKLLYDNFFEAINVKMSEEDLMSLIYCDISLEKYNYLKDFSFFEDGHKEKAFLCACINNKVNNNQNMKLISDLLFNGVDINVVVDSGTMKISDRRNNGNSALFYACVNKDMPLINFLIQNGADICNKNFRGSLKKGFNGTILEYLCENRYKNYSDIILLLLDHFSSDKEIFIEKNSNALYFACINNSHNQDNLSIDIVKKLLEYGFDPNIPYGLYVCLHIAAAEGNIKLAQLLLDYNADINAVNSNYSPLYQALLHDELISKNIEMMEFLVDKGADVNRKNEHTKRTPLHLACTLKQYEVIKYLIEKGASVLNIDEAEKWLDTKSFWIENKIKIRNCTIDRSKQEEIKKLIAQKKEEQLIEIKQKAHEVKNEVAHAVNRRLIDATWFTYAVKEMYEKRKVHGLSQKKILENGGQNSSSGISQVTEHKSRRINIPILISIFIKLAFAYCLF